MLVDTHCHLHFKEFDEDRGAVIERAREAGVRFLINVGTDPATNEAAYRLASGYDFMRHTAGLHPHHAHEIFDAGLEPLKLFVKEKKPAAIGEIGLDYFKSEAEPGIQKKVFARMLAIAAEYKLPVIVHSREAFKDTLDILKTEAKGKVKGVMHCFSYDQASLKELLDIGFSASFTCNVTFKNAADLLEVAAYAPLDRLMLETDSPYLAPQAHRGQRNEPAHLVHLARLLAQKREIDRAELEYQTSQNALKFFRLGSLV